MFKPCRDELTIQAYNAWCTVENYNGIPKSLSWKSPVFITLFSRTKITIKVYAKMTKLTGPY